MRSSSGRLLLQLRGIQIVFTDIGHSFLLVGVTICLATVTITVRTTIMAHTSIIIVGIIGMWLLMMLLC
jgi:hypothetical protein